MSDISFKYKVTGIQGTIQRLQNFETKFRRSVLRKAGNAGAGIALKALKALAPVKSGTWKKSVGRKVQVKNGGLSLWYGVGPRSKMFAFVTFDPGGEFQVQNMERRRRDGREETRTTGRERTRKTGAVGGRVALIKKSKRVADGQPALFWRGRDGKVKAMPLKRKYWPVLYSHLIEKGTKTGGKAHRMIERTHNQTRARQEEAIKKILEDAVGGA